MSETTAELLQPNLANNADIWDDSLLIKAYDDSVTLAREELARRIASSTNSRNAEQAANSGSKSTEEQNPSGEEVPPAALKAGDYVRATYDDGIDYEAKILFIYEDEGSCLLKYIGYDNEQTVDLCDLVPSWGKKARRNQFDKAKQIAKSSDGTKAGVTAKASKTRYSSDFSFGAVPPPPPMPPMLGQGHEDSEHLSAMLMSWYMSGYYTGVYQGIQMAKKSKSKK